MELQNHNYNKSGTGTESQRLSYSGGTSDKVNSKKRKKIKKSKSSKAIWVATTILLLFSAYLVNVLFNLQVLEYDSHALAATASHYKKIVETPMRGSIYDRNGRELALSTVVENIGITPSDVKSRNNTKISEEDIAKGIAGALSLDVAEVLNKIKQKDKTWIILKKRVEKVESDKLKKFRKDNEIGGISIDPIDKRYYPQGKIAANVIGFNSPDGMGQLGLEYQYNGQMTGEPGYTYAQTDNYGQAMLPFAVPISLRARNGYNVISTIDIEIQKIIENELKNSIEIYNVAEGGVAIVMDPYTGSVLGMTSSPGFDLSNPTAAPPGQDIKTWDPTKLENIKYLSKNVWRNRAISDTYEPGSTFKALTAAMAMEEGKYLESEMLSDAPIKIADRIIGCSQKGGHGIETAERGFWNSCNPIFVQLANRLGILKYYSYVRGFGFADLTGIDLPGEGKGLFHAAPTQLDMSCLAFGEQSTVTPLSMITSYNVFANGGSLMRPQVVRSLTDSDGNVVKEISPETVRRVVSEETATRIRTLLKGVVLYGTGSKGYVEGYSVGGKTSTSTRGKMVGDEIIDKKNDISFLSMAPVEQPVITILVVLFAPQEKNARSSLAALTSAKMTSKILEYMSIPRVYTSNDVSVLTKKNPVPNLQGLTFKEARVKLQAAGLNIDDPSGVMGDETKVLFQNPVKDFPLNKGGTIAVYSSASATQPLATVPDIKGKNVNECIRAMTESGINIIIDGDCLGTAISQSILPGTKVVQRSMMSVVFSTQEQENDDVFEAVTPTIAVTPKPKS